MQPLLRGGRLLSRVTCFSPPVAAHQVGAHRGRGAGQEQGAVLQAVQGAEGRLQGQEDRGVTRLHGEPLRPPLRATVRRTLVAVNVRLLCASLKRYTPLRHRACNTVRDGSSQE
jgi:hypothetical protein